jgi:putative ATP-binding cassette transporter
MFSKYAPNRTFFAIALGATAGIFYALLIPIVSKALEADSNRFEFKNEIVEVYGLTISNFSLALLFFFFCLLVLISKSLSEILVARIAMKIRYIIRDELYQKIQSSALDSLEKVGPSRLIQTLSTDVAAIVAASQLFPQLLTNAFTVLCMLLYLVYIDYSVFVFVTKVIGVGVLAYQIPIILGKKYFVRGREHLDTLQEGFKGLVEGSKELKLDRIKSNLYRNEVLNKEELIIKRNEEKGVSIFALASNLGGLLTFIAIGGLGFAFINESAVSVHEIMSSLMVLLYLSGPIAMILNYIPQITRTNISIKKIEALYKDLPSEPISGKIEPVAPWKSLRLEDVYYSYYQNENSKSRFGVGPINIAIERGKITFITGGNGAGKSTLAKLITQHYFPSNGRIFYDDTEICYDNIEAFRQEISSIYSDYYLFDRLLYDRSIEESYLERFNYFLGKFKIDDKVSINNGRFSSSELSDGQRRRLALVFSIVEDKPLMLFDEWAADQDPVFKKIFYEEILPFLKNENKAVVVISHDDRFFDVADNLIVLDSGCLSEQHNAND